MVKRKRHHPSRKDDKARSFQVEPKNKPEVIDYHLAGSDEKGWTKHPGNLVAIISGTRAEDTDEKIIKLIGPLLKLSLEKQNKKLSEKLIDARHKLHAVRYHLITIQTEISQRVSQFEKNYNAGAGVASEIENPRLVYETEAFLFQVKSSLDILTQTLACVIPPLKSSYTFGHKQVKGEKQAGGAVIKALLDHGFDELGNLLESHRINWIQELVVMRDIVAHDTLLHNFHCFIEGPYMGGNQVTIHYPTMPSGTRVDNYCQTIYGNLLNLYRSALDFIRL